MDQRSWTIDLNQRSTSYNTSSTIMARVIDTDDPDNLGRVKIRIPAYHGPFKGRASSLDVDDKDLPWAKVATPMNPQKDGYVYVTFDSNNPDYPIVVAVDQASNQSALSQLMSALAGGSEEGAGADGSYVEGVGVEPSGVLKVALAEVGNTNGTKYDNSGGAWCAYFVQWCFKKAYGKKKRTKLIGGFSGMADTTVRNCIKKGKKIPKDKGQPGDIITWDYDHNNFANHVGIIYKVHKNTYECIEGNHSNRVAHTTYRKKSDTYLIGRPPYQALGLSVTAEGGTKLKSTSGGAGATGKIYLGNKSFNCRWPLKKKGVITSTYGPRSCSYGSSWHKGIDICNGSQIVAAHTGKVVHRGHVGSGYGNSILLWHADLGFSTFYAHMSTVYVKKGQTVQKGTVIGLMGGTGTSSHSYPTHLHYGVTKSKSVDSATFNPTWVTNLPKGIKQSGASGFKGYVSRTKYSV